MSQKYDRLRSRLEELLQPESLEEDFHRLTFEAEER